MTRYYFDIQQDKSWYQDEFGVEMTDLREVKDQVIALLPNLARDEHWSEDHHQIICRVRDDANDAVYEGELTFEGRVLKQ